MNTLPKSVLCYGDSNTWGYVPGRGTRLARFERWPGVLQGLLGERCHVIEEGLNGRSTVWDEPFRQGRSGLQMLAPLLESHAPLDLVILMLGTNDLQHHLHVSTHESSRGLATLLEAVQKSTAGIDGRSPPLLVIAPPKLGVLSTLMAQHYEGGRERSAVLPERYRKVCAELRHRFLDANEVVSAGDDGVHLNSAAHRRLADALAPVVQELLGLAGWSTEAPGEHEC